MDDTEPATEPANPPPRQGRWRRFVRGRAGTLTVGRLVGALLGAAGVAWRTDTVPFLSGGEDRLCWGAFSQRDALRLMPDLEERDSSAGGDGEGGAPWSEQLPSQHRGFADQDAYGECHIGMGDRPGGSVTVRLHQLDKLRGDDEKVWPDDYLSPEMTSFGATGSDNRVWGWPHRHTPGGSFRTAATPRRNTPRTSWTCPERTARGCPSGTVPHGT